MAAPVHSKSNGKRPMNRMRIGFPPEAYRTLLALVVFAIAAFVPAALNAGCYIEERESKQGAIHIPKSDKTKARGGVLGSVRIRITLENSSSFYDSNARVHKLPYDVDNNLKESSYTWSSAAPCLAFYAFYQLIAENRCSDAQRLDRLTPMTIHAMATRAHNTDTAYRGHMTGKRPKGYLQGNDLKQLIQNAPLISIDLIIRDNDGSILFGRRINEPAKGRWFVPGGRILKDERLGQAFERICRDEIGKRWRISDAQFIGVFEHFYANNVLGAEGISTHYIVLAYGIRSDSDIRPPKADQHTEYRWFKSRDDDSDIHEYAAAYFDHM